MESYRNVFDQFENLNDKVRDALLSIKGLIGIVNMRDDYTYSHTERVVYCCEVVADYMKLDEESRRTLLISAYMHDIGKVNIPREVLITSERFTDEQWEMIKNHPTAGRNIISKIEGMDMIGRIIEQHHERCDGYGYPFGLTRFDELLAHFDVDVVPASPRYIGPELPSFVDAQGRTIYNDYWGYQYTMHKTDLDEYPITTYYPLNGVETVEDVNRAVFPDPDWFDYSAITEACVSALRSVAEDRMRRV